MSHAGRDSKGLGSSASSSPLPLLPRTKRPGRRSGLRFLSIGAKLGLAVVLVVTLASVLAFFFSAARERDALVLAKQQSADMLADLFAESLRAPLDFGDADAVQVEIQHLKQNHDLVFAGVWHAPDDKPMGKLGNEQARQDGAQVGLRSTQVIEVSRQVKGGDGQVVGRAKLQFSLQRENEAYLAGRLRILWLCLAVALGTVGVLLTVTRRQVVAPVDALLKAVRRLERGERDVAVDVYHHDEIGRLARGVEAMGGAIRDREDRLAEALGSLRELFDHMRQAIVVFDSRGRVVGAQSREARKIFGVQQLEGASIRELLYAGRGAWDAELKAFDDWLALVFDARAEDFADLLPLAPPEVRVAGVGHERVLSLEFRPIEGKGVIQRVMLLASDETEKRQLAEAVVAQGQTHARQMAAMQRLVAGGGQQFVGFLRGARERVVRALALCSGRTLLPLSDFNECFGHVHTLRGEARVFGLEELAQHLETLEQRLSELRSLALAQNSAEVSFKGVDVAGALDQAQPLLGDAERLFVAASPIGRAVLEQVTVRRPDLEELCRLSAAQGGRLSALSERLSARSLGELLAPFGDRTVRWAESVNKRARLEVEGREALIPEKLARVLSGALTHLLRNAVAHGIEAPDDRERKGKPPVGVVTVGATAAPGDLASLVYVEDDGVGVQANPLLDAALQRESALTSEDADSGSFRQAAPSAENELSGRGMGLSAVLRDLAASDFELRVCKSASGGARFEIVRRAAGDVGRISA